MAGAERGLAIINGTIAGGTVIGLNTLWWIPIAILIHGFLVWLNKRDPMLRMIYMRYNRQSDRYDPWPHVETNNNPRPDGFDRGNLC